MVVVLRKSLYRDAKEPISWHEIGFIGMQYGHYQSAKWPLLQHYEKKTDLSRYEYAVYIQFSRHARFYFAKKYCKDFFTSENEYLCGFMAVYGFIAKLLMPADSELPAP